MGLGQPLLTLLAAITEPFEQGEGPEQGKREGAGLGLAISRSICELLGCSLEIASDVGTGTIVTVTLAEVPGGEGSTRGDPPYL